MNDRIERALKAIKELSDEPNEKELWDKALDLIEAVVKSTPTRLDDVIAMPLIRIIRRRLDIRD